MTQIHHIRKLFFEEGMNISQIASVTGHDRKTIRSKLSVEDWNQEIPKVSGKTNNYPSLDPFKVTIISWMVEDKRHKRKQRHTAKRIFDRLCDEFPEEFNGSYRTVAGFVASQKEEIFGKKKTSFLPLEHIPGEAQLDFGDADFYHHNKLVNGKYLNLSFPHSNQGYLQLFKGENQQCLFEGLLSIFKHVGGVPQRIWFDNATTIVTKILKEGKRNLTDDFLRLQSHYQFEAAFCNPNSGNEKGSVETKVRYHRSNALVPVPRVESLEAYNRELLLWCDRDSKRDHYRKNNTINELHKEDREALIPLPAVDLDVSKYIPVRTNSYAKFYLNNGLHEYSSNPKLSNKSILVRLTSEHVTVLDESHREVVRHQRLYGEHKQSSMQWLPYLNQLSRHPAALKYTGIYQMLPEAMQTYLSKCTRSQKGAILKSIASLTEQDSFENAIKAVESALIHEAYDIDSLVNLYTGLNGNLKYPAPLKLDSHIPKLSPIVTNLSTYDRGLNLKRGDRDE